MNKTVTINLNRTVYHIDEAAYDTLYNYLQALKKHFTKSDSSDEIMADIEARISELLQMKLKGNKQVVQAEDIDEIIGIMGKAEDMGDASEQAQQADNSKKNNDEKSSFKTKRLYRDTDNRILGGVCSGMAYYFSVDPVIVRIIFLLTFFFAGPLLYLIAWGIIPKALSTAEKIEMRGEPMDINSIEKNIKEEFNDVKNRFKEYKRDFRQNRGADFFYNIIHYMGRAIGLLFAFVLIAVGIALLTGLSISTFSVNSIDCGEGNICMQTFMQHFVNAPQDFSMGAIGLFLFFGIPLLLIIWGGISILLGIRNRFKLIGYTGFVLWVAGIFLIGYAGAKTGHSFGEKAFVKTDTSFSVKGIKAIRINTTDPLDDCINTAGDRINTKHLKIADCENGLIFYGEPQIKVEYTLSDTVSIEIVKKSRGSSKQDARERAKNIEFVINQQDSTLLIDKYFELKNIDKWRKQEVRIIIKVPESKKQLLSDDLQ